MKKIFILILFSCFFILPLLSSAQGQPGNMEIEIGLPHPAKAMIDLGTQYFKDKNYDQAIATYEKVFSDFPETIYAAQAQFKIANVYHWGKKKPQKALSLYQNVIDKYPDSKFAAESLARIGSIYHWELDEPYPYTAIHYYRRMLSAAPDDEYAPETLFWIGEAYRWIIDNIDRAMKTYQSVINIYPSSDYAIGSMLRLGDAYRRRQQFDKAQEFYRQIIDKYPDSSYAPQSKITLADVINFDIFEPLRAKPLYQEIVAKYPETEYAATANLWLVRIAKENNEIPANEAIQIYRQIIVSNPQLYNVQSAAQYTIGSTYLLEGKIQEALNEFQKVLDNYPKTHKDWLVLTLYFMSHAYTSLGEYSKAEAMLIKGIEDYPGSLWEYALKIDLDLLKTQRSQ